MGKVHAKFLAKLVAPAGLEFLVHLGAVQSLVGEADHFIMLHFILINRTAFPEGAKFVSFHCENLLINVTNRLRMFPVKKPGLLQLLFENLSDFKNILIVGFEVPIYIKGFNPAIAVDNF